MHSTKNNLNVLYLEHNKTLKHKTTEKVFHGQFKSPFIFLPFLNMPGKSLIKILNLKFFQVFRFEQFYYEGF